MSPRSFSLSKKLRLLAEGSAGVLKRISQADALFLAAGLVLAVALRLTLLDFRSLDYYASLKPWYNTIRDGGFGAFATAFSTYNPPYLYILYLIARFLPDTPVVVAVKLPALAADFVCAGMVGLLVRFQAVRRRRLPFLAALAVLFAPSVVLNSAFWGQADSLLAAGILACVVFLVVGRPSMAMIAFGIALAFKLQAIFLAPVVLAMAMQRRIPWRTLLWVPLVLFLAIVPAWIAGRPLGDLLQVYAYQTSQFEFITMNAPSVYAFVPETKRVFNLLYIPGVILGGAVSFLWFVLLWRSRRPIEGRLIVSVALASMLIVPLFLPKMHERYFYAADMLAIAVAFLEPALFYLPLVVVGVSSLAYQPFLFERTYVPLSILALALVAVSAHFVHRTLMALFRPAEDGLSAASAAAPRSEPSAKAEGSFR